MRKRLRSKRSRELGKFEQLENRELLAGDGLVGVLTISELMTTNNSVLETRLRTSPSTSFRGETMTPDWIEIHNASDEAKDLSGLYLSDNSLNPKMWQIPSGTVINGNDYLVIYASGSDVTDVRLDETGRLHTNFKLDLKGDYLGLNAADGSLIDEYARQYPAQHPDISYGRDATGTEVYFLEATPGATNSVAYAGKVDDTSFSVNRGFFDAPFQVEIATRTPGAEIRYTLDGSEPTESNGQTYQGPITIATTTNLRAAAFKEGMIPTDVDTQSYLFVEQIIRQPAEIAGFPFGGRVWAGSDAYVPQDQEMDPEIVDDPAYSGVIRQSLLAIPTMSITSDMADIFGNTGWYDGEDVEHGVSVEILYPDDPAASHQSNAGIESHSHDRLKRSLRLSFREAYGEDEWETDLFQRMPIGGDTATNRHDTIVLRGGNNRSWARVWNPDRTAYTEDEFFRQSQIAMSGYGMRGSFVHLYINGVYWGLYNPTERIDPDFTSNYFGGEPEDWFTINHGGDLQGVDDRWDTLQQKVMRKDMTIAENYDELQEYLAVEEFADYLIAAWWTAVSDWPQNNWYGAVRNETSTLGEGPAMYFAWDGEWSWGQGGESSSTGQAHVHTRFRASSRDRTGIPGLWNAARVNSDFLTMFSDRVYKHLFNDGAMTEENAKQRWQTLNNYIRDAVVAESARWGDSLEAVRQPTRTRDVDWQRMVNRIDWLMTGNNAVFIAALRREGYYPSIDAPNFNQEGGRVAKGFELFVTNPNAEGTIYYTLDGTDPRQSGGALSNAAQTATSGATIPLQTDALVNARIRKADGEWSPLHAVTFLIETETPIIISELMYHPADPTLAEVAAGIVDSDDFEFIELHNRSAVAQNLTGLRLTEGVHANLPAETLGPGETAVMVASEAAFRLRYGNQVRVLGQFERGRLDNGGERLTLRNSLDEEVFSFQYSDGWNWSLRADGLGASLEVVDVDAIDPLALDHPSSWRGSAQLGGSPGIAARPADSPVRINEVLSNSPTDQNLPDAIELFNDSDNPIDVGGWYLSDSGSNLAKYRIPDGTRISARGFLRFDEQDFNPTPATPAPQHFALSGNRGDEVWLVRLDDNGQVLQFIDEVRFGAVEPGESLGRVDHSLSTLFPQRTRTLGGENSLPRVGPVVISEVQYQPLAPSLSALLIDPTLVANDLEYIELYNSAGQTIDLSQWRLRGGVDIDFDTNTLLPAAGTILVLPFDPASAANAAKLAAFRAHYNLTDQALLTGGYQGQLNRSGDRLQLQRKGAVPADDPTAEPHWFQDEVQYDEVAPWPQLVAGVNASLQRATPLSFGNDPTTWKAGMASPGVVQFTNGDLDGDGTRDGRDVDHFCQLKNAGDHAADLNQDGVIDEADLDYLVLDVLHITFGDANADGVYNSSDLVQVFLAGEYEDGIAGNSTWAEGDWNCDGEFNSKDIIKSFLAGGYSTAAKPRVEVDLSAVAAAIDIAFRDFGVRDKTTNPRAHYLAQNRQAAE